MDYSFFGHFLSYIQMMAAIDLALIFIDKGSLAVKLQNRILEFIQEKAQSTLNEAGATTQRCRKDRLLSRLSVLTGHLNVVDDGIYVCHCNIILFQRSHRMF